MRTLSLLFLTSSILLANAHIFVYHRFGDARYESTNTSIKLLREQFNYFKKNNYQVVALSQIVKRLQTKEKIPDNWVAFTIDDSYKSFYEHGLPVFKEYGYPFTIFVYCKATNKRYKDFMSWTQLKDATNYGEIGAHSYGHGHLTKLSNEKLTKDFARCNEDIQKNLGFTPEYFAYPYGEYDERVQNIAKSFGFKAIFNQNSGAVNHESNIFDINRIALTGTTSLKAKLRIKELKATWIEPKSYPKNGIIQNVKIHVYEDINKAQLYISGHGWQNVSVNQGVVNITLNKKLKLSRTRMFLKYKNQWTNKILVK